MDGRLKANHSATKNRNHTPTDMGNGTVAPLSGELFGTGASETNIAPPPGRGRMRRSCRRPAISARTKARGAPGASSQLLIRGVLEVSLAVTTISRWRRASRAARQQCAPQLPRLQPLLIGARFAAGQRIDGSPPTQPSGPHNQSCASGGMPASRKKGDLKDTRTHKPCRAPPSLLSS